MLPQEREPRVARPNDALRVVLKPCERRSGVGGFTGEQLRNTWELLGSIDEPAPRRGNEANHKKDDPDPPKPSHPAQLLGSQRLGKLDGRLSRPRLHHPCACCRSLLLQPARLGTPTA